MRQIFAIIAGLVVAVLIIFMAQMIKEGLYPTPRALDFDDKSEVQAWIETLPNLALWIITISHALAALCSGFIASLTAGSNRMAMGILSASTVFILVLIYLFTYFFPTWFVLTDTAITAILGFAGVILGSTRIVS